MNKDKIYTTTDYSKFVLIQGNRVVEEQERRVKGLSESIKLRGLKNPILVIEDDKTGKLIMAKKIPEIPAASLADIAFMLLIVTPSSVFGLILILLVNESASVASVSISFITE